MDRCLRGYVAVSYTHLDVYKRQVLGPAGFGILSETSFIKSVAEIGVIVLMFSAGMETDIKELKASGKASFVIALCGVIVPLLGGFAVAWFFNKPGMIESSADASIFLQNIFIGVILTATSAVSYTHLDVYKRQTLYGAWPRK